MAPDAQAVARRAIALRHLAGFALSSPPRSLLARWKSAWSPADRRSFLEEAQQDRIERWQSLGAWKRCFTARERAIFDCTVDELTERDHLNAGWRTEGVHVLAWALRACEKLLPYDRQASLKTLKKFASGDLDRFVGKARLRPRREIEAARELAEFWHWRSRTRQSIEGGQPLEPTEHLRAEGIETYDDIVRRAARNARKRGDLSVVRDDFKVFGKAYREITDAQWSEVRSVTMERHLTLNWLCGHAPRNSWEQTPTDT